MPFEAQVQNFLQKLGGLPGAVPTPPPAPITPSAPVTTQSPMVKPFFPGGKSPFSLPDMSGLRNNLLSPHPAPPAPEAENPSWAHSVTPEFLSHFRNSERPPLQSTTLTPRSVIAPYYQNAGGLDPAMAAANNYRDNNNKPGPELANLQSNFSAAKAEENAQISPDPHKRFEQILHAMSGPKARAVSDYADQHPSEVPVQQWADPKQIDYQTRVVSSGIKDEGMQRGDMVQLPSSIGGFQDQSLAGVTPDMLKANHLGGYGPFANLPVEDVAHHELNHLVQRNVLEDHNAYPTSPGAVWSQSPHGYFDNLAERVQGMARVKQETAALTGRRIDAPEDFQQLAKEINPLDPDEKAFEQRISNYSPEGQRYWRFLRMNKQDMPGMENTPAVWKPESVPTHNYYDRMIEEGARQMPGMVQNDQPQNFEQKVAEFIQKLGEEPRSAVLVKGNPKYTKTPEAEAFYKHVGKVLTDSGYKVTEDAGKPHTMPAKADLWVGHSRGNERFRFADPSQKVVRLGDKHPDAINHPDDKGKPGTAHFTLSSAMEKVLKEKIAETELPLEPHQRRLVNKLVGSNHGMVAYHSPGSGKTLSAIDAMKESGRDTLVAPPAALRENFKKELKKWDPKHEIKTPRMQSQQNASVGGLQPTTKENLVVVDEAHRARDPKSKLYQTLAKSPAKKLLMTGSGVYNHPADLSSLVNLAANKNVLPTDRTEFEKKFVNYEKVNPGFLQRMVGLSAGEKPVLNATPDLKDAYKKYVDFYETKKQNKDYPTLKEEEKLVDMTPKQTELYNAIMGKAPWWTRMKVKAGLPPSRKELAKLKAFLTGPRQASNSTAAFYPNLPVDAAKAHEAFSSFQKQMAANPHHKAVVYSNFLNSGLADYKKLLDANQVPYGEFSGEIPDADRQKSVRDFNANKLKALLISSAGAEGLDLKGTRQVQLLEPHWNEEKERQIIGRARRFQSHAGLPENERNVTVERYMARPKGSFLDRIMGGGHARGVDEYLRDMAKQKTDLNDQVINLLRDQQKRSIFGL